MTIEPLQVYFPLGLANFGSKTVSIKNSASPLKVPSITSAAQSKSIEHAFEGTTLSNYRHYSRSSYEEIYLCEASEPLLEWVDPSATIFEGEGSYDGEPERYKLPDKIENRSLPNRRVPLRAKPLKGSGDGWSEIWTKEWGRYSHTLEDG